MPVSGRAKADAEEQPETQLQHATRLYQAVAQAACERSDEADAEGLWQEVVWSLLRHLPWQEACAKHGDKHWWCEGLAPPQRLSECKWATETRPRCAGMVVPVVAFLLLHYAPRFILRPVLEPVALAMLAVMCGRYAGTPFREWRAVTDALVDVLKASGRFWGQVEEGEDGRGSAQSRAS